MTRLSAYLTIVAAFLMAFLGEGGSSASASESSSSSSLVSHPTVHLTGPTTYPAPIGDLGETVCTSASACVAIGSISRQPQEVPAGIVATTSDAGETWTSEPLPTAGGLSGLSCPSSTLCIAVGGHLGRGGSSTNPDRLGTAAVSTDGGHTWEDQTLPNGVGYLNAVSCASVSYCMAVGETPDGTGGTAVATTSQGAMWSRITLPPNEALTLVACPVARVCLAVAENALLRTTDGGLAWTMATPQGGVSVASGISCATVMRCVAVGSGIAGDANPTPAIDTTDNGGVTWSGFSPTTPASTNASGGLEAVSCGTPTTCMAVGGGIGPRGGSGVGVVFTTTDGGLTWRGKPSPPGMGGLEGVSCVGSLHCVLNGSDPTAAVSLSAVTANGGLSWATRTVAVGIGGLQAVSCPASLQCVAVGTDASTTYVVRTTDGGKSWSAQTMAGGVVGLSAVSCGSPRDCVAVGFQTVPGQLESGALEGAVVTTADGGATWDVQVLPNGVGYLSAVSCPSALRCLALGDAAGVNQAIVLSTVNGGVTWAAPVALPMTSAVEGVSCASTTYCVAVGEKYPDVPGPAVPVAEVTRDAGSVWAGDPLPGRGEEPAGISCPTTSLCVAVGAVTHDVTCCSQAVVPGALMLSHDGGSRWGPSTKVAAGNLVAVACSTATFCALVGRDRAGSGPVILTGDPGHLPLSATTPPGAAGAFLAVSCNPAQACEVAGQSPFGGGFIAKSIARSRAR